MGSQPASLLKHLRSKQAKANAVSFGQLRVILQPVALEVLHKVGLPVRRAYLCERLADRVAVDRQSAMRLPVSRELGRHIVARGSEVDRAGTGLGRRSLECRFRLSFLGH